MNALDKTLDRFGIPKTKETTIFFEKTFDKLSEVLHGEQIVPTDNRTRILFSMYNHFLLGKNSVVS